MMNYYMNIMVIKMKMIKMKMIKIKIMIKMMSF